MSANTNASRVFYRTLATDFPMATGAAGVYLTDSTGKQYLDASGGAAVCPVGHGNKRVIEAVKAQLDRMAFAHTSFFTNDPAEQLAAILSDKAPGGVWRTYFVSGGSEANEAALKMARQIQFERGDVERSHFISRHMAYHGSTIATMAIGTIRASSELYKPLLPGNVEKIMPCFPFRWQKDGESAADFLTRSSGELEAVIQQLGDKRAICFIAETVSGATLGAVPPVPGYFKAIREICDRHGVLMILDEVMAGMGRCGTLFACEQDGVVPDMITLAKGLGGGYQPLGAVMVREELVSELEQGSGAFVHGHTYVGHASACAAGLAVQQVFEEDKLVEQVASKGDVLAAKLEAAFGDHPHVGDLRGRGFFRGIEIVKDRQTNEPFDSAAGVAMKIKKAAMDEGLVCYPMGGTIDGKNGDPIMLAPPFIYEAHHMDEMVEKLGRAIDMAIGGVD
ncbi:MAG TPA: aspartate aminotransferase family protein [Rhizobiales bacterium]|nr:aspartate aminotransferase family protein [Hyphomicrobiales bacterium]